MKTDEFINKLSALNKDDQRAILTSLSPLDLCKLQYHWPLWARPKQLIQSDDFRILLLLCGRGFGKTRTISEYVRQCVNKGTNKISIVAPTSKDIRDTIVKGDSGILSVFPPHERPRWNATTQTIHFQNGASAICYSGEEPDRLRGANTNLTIVDEFAAMMYPDEVLTQCELITRIGTNPRIVIATTPKPIIPIRKLVEDASNGAKRIKIINGSTYENRNNLAQEFFEALQFNFSGTTIARQELYGEVVLDVPGAMFSHSVFEASRVTAAPQFRNIVIAIDPAGSTGNRSDETGILVAGLGQDNHTYVLEDASGKMTPNDWAYKTSHLYNKWKATKVIVESNFGGQMTETTLRQCNPWMSISATHVTTSKAQRFSTVSALFEKQIAHIVGKMPALENQCAQYTPSLQNSQHDDRLDAMCAAINYLVYGSVQPRMDLRNVPFA